MSNAVVISKELRDELDSWFTRMNENWRGMNALDRLVFLNKMFHFQDQLRTAPETVSLEGVERWTFNGNHMRKHFDGEFAKVSDLRRLVAPVQPSAVVSRNTAKRLVYKWRDSVTDRERWTGLKDADWTALINAVQEALQLPQPVAPVRGGGVDTTLSKLIDILGWQGGTIHEALSEVLTLVKFHENHHPTCKQSLQVDTAKGLVERLKWYIDEVASLIGRTGRHCADMKDADEFLAHLTTTQSTPSVGSDPLVFYFEIDEGEGDHEEQFVKKSEYDDVVHTHLTSRMEGK